MSIIEVVLGLLMIIVCGPPYLMFYYLGMFADWFCRPFQLPKRQNGAIHGTADRSPRRAF